MRKFVVLLIVIVLNVTGCARPDRKQVHPSHKVLGLIDSQQFVPRAYRKQYFDHTPTDRPDPDSEYAGDENYSYEQGWQDGCQTATSAMGTGLARIRGPKIDGYRLSEDPLYLRGYQDSTLYCTLTLDWETH